MNLAQVNTALNFNSSSPVFLNLSTFSVWQLRKAGYKVSVEHSRYTVSEFFTKRPPLRHQTEIPKGLIAPCGGKTVVRVREPGGIEYEGSSLCSREDNFCKRRGVFMALGRLLQQNVSSLEELRPIRNREWAEIGTVLNNVD